MQNKSKTIKQTICKSKNKVLVLWRIKLIEWQTSAIISKDNTWKNIGKKLYSTYCLSILS